MTTPTTDTPDRDAETLDSQGMRAAKRRRASRAPSMSQAGGGSGEAGEPVNTRVPKLTKGQRAILIRVISTHHYINTVRDVLAEDYPEFPEISDNLIRYYRAQIEAGVLDEAKVARQAALRNGLANKAVRVRHLIRMVEDWRKVPIVQVVDGVVTSIRVDASREQRELLKQIAQELGQYDPDLPAGSSGGLDENGEDEDEAADDDVRSDLQEIIRTMAEQDNATRAALLAAERPAPEGA